MRMNTVLVLALTATTLVASTATSFAGNGGFRPRNGFAVFDANTGNKVFDDGKLDGKGCAVGSVATFDPATGKFGSRPSFKCNFRQ